MAQDLTVQDFTFTQKGKIIQWGPGLQALYDSLPAELLVAAGSNSPDNPLDPLDPSKYKPIQGGLLLSLHTIQILTMEAVSLQDHRDARGYNFVAGHDGGPSAHDDGTGWSRSSNTQFNEIDITFDEISYIFPKAIPKLYTFHFNGLSGFGDFADFITETLSGKAATGLYAFDAIANAGGFTTYKEDWYLYGVIETP